MTLYSPSLKEVAVQEPSISPSVPDDESTQRLFGCLCQTPVFERLNQHLHATLNRRTFLGGSAALLVGAFVLPPKSALARAPDAPKGPVVFTDVRVFDGKSGTLRTGMRVVVEGQRIKAIEPQNNPLPAGALVIAGGGRTLMPGLIDAHWHAMMASLPMAALLSSSEGYLNLKAAEEAERTLMRGFTTVRDLAGPTFALKRAIDEGGFAGPRIWPSGAMISQTSGHGDYRQPFELPVGNLTPPPRTDTLGATAIADGVSEVLKRAREQLMLGASQLKLAAGGGGVVELRPAGRLAVHRSRVPCCRGCGRKLGHLCHRPCLHAARHPDRHPWRCALHRPRPADGRGHCTHHGGEGHLVQRATFPGR
jgi:hypothetical protein